MTNPPSDLRTSSSRPVPLPERARHYGIGLRAQTLLGLTAAFLIAFSALSIIVVQAAQKSQQLEQNRRAALLLEALAQTLPAASDRPARERVLASLVGHADIGGLRLEPAQQRVLAFGELHGQPTAVLRLPRQERLSVWLRTRDLDSVSPLARLLRLYSLLTGSLILAVVYIALTRLIVRPVEDLTRAVERWKTELSPSEPVVVAGAAEVVRLGVAFNGMARELRREKGELEQRLQELTRTASVLRSTQDQLIRSEKLAGVGRLAAGVAHEIGNPLAAILGLVELLQLGSVSRGDEAEFLARIRGETERIHHIIRDLLDYARTRSEEETGASADLEQVVEEAVALVAPQKDLRRVTLERRVYGSALRVAGSAHELTQIVINLLLNAADAVAGDGHIMIELTRDEGFVALAVSDSGPGIPARVRDKIFDPFVTTKPAGKGTGLGLAVCHAIVERLGGSIRGDNLPHSGARFVVRLPQSNR